MASWRSTPSAAFDALYDQHKKAIHKLKEHRRTTYEKLRLATAKPNEVPWHLPDSIDFRASRRIPSGIATCLWKAMGSSGPSWAPGRPAC
jgi:hypothetical protein